MWVVSLEGLIDSHWSVLNPNCSWIAEKTQNYTQIYNAGCWDAPLHHSLLYHSFKPSLFMYKPYHLFWCSYKLQASSFQTPILQLFSSTNILTTLKLSTHKQSILKQNMQLSNTTWCKNEEGSKIYKSFAPNTLSSPLLLSRFQMTMRRREKGRGVVAAAARVSPWLPRGVVPMATVHWRPSIGVVPRGMWRGAGMGGDGWWGKWRR